MFKKIMGFFTILLVVNANAQQPIVKMAIENDVKSNITNKTTSYGDQIVEDVSVPLNNKLSLLVTLKQGVNYDKIGKTGNSFINFLGAGYKLNKTTTVSLYGDATFNRALNGKVTTNLGLYPFFGKGFKFVGKDFSYGGFIEGAKTLNTDKQIMYLSNRLNWMINKNWTVSYQNVFSRTSSAEMKAIYGDNNRVVATYTLPIKTNKKHQKNMEEIKTILGK